MDIHISPIGKIKSKYTDADTGGRQPTIDGQEGSLIINKQFHEGLCGLELFSHIIALYYFHQQNEVKMKAKPCFDPSIEHGIFASRYPTRPNHIGISIWSIKSVKKNIITCHDIDVLNGTPLLDIKPYVKQFDHRENTRCGWYDLIDWSSVESKAFKNPEITEA